MYRHRNNSKFTLTTCFLIMILQLNSCKLNTLFLYIDEHSKIFLQNAKFVNSTLLLTKYVVIFDKISFIYILPSHALQFLHMHKK